MINTLLHISEHHIHWEHSGPLRYHLREQVRKLFSLIWWLSWRCPLPKHLQWEINLLILLLQYLVQALKLLLRNILISRITTCIGKTPVLYTWLLANILQLGPLYTNVMFHVFAQNKHQKIFNILQHTEKSLSYKVCKCHHTVTKRLQTKAPYF